MMRRLLHATRDRYCKGCPSELPTLSHADAKTSRLSPRWNRITLSIRRSGHRTEAPSLQIIATCCSFNFACREHLESPRVSNSTSRAVGELGWAEHCAWKGVWGGEADSACIRVRPWPYDIVFGSGTTGNNGIITHILHALLGVWEDRWMNRW